MMPGESKIEAMEQAMERENQLEFCGKTVGWEDVDWSRYCGMERRWREHEKKSSFIDCPSPVLLAHLLASRNDGPGLQV